MLGFDSLKELGIGNKTSSIRDSLHIDFERVNKERAELDLERHKNKFQKELLSEEREEAKLEELKRQNFIHLQSYEQLEKVNKNLETQVSKLEEALKNQEKELDFLKTDSRENSEDMRFSKKVSIISTLIAVVSLGISGASLWVSIKK